MAVLDTLKAIAPQYESIGDDTLNTYITLAAQRIAPAVFGEVYEQAVAYLAAHMLVMNRDRKGASGPVTSERAGEVARSYGFSPDYTNSYYGATGYGREFLSLRRSRVDTKPLSTMGDF